MNCAGSRPSRTKTKPCRLPSLPLCPTPSRRSLKRQPTRSATIFHSIFWIHQGIQLTWVGFPRFSSRRFLGGGGPPFGSKVSRPRWNVFFPSRFLRPTPPPPRPAPTPLPPTPHPPPPRS